MKKNTYYYLQVVNYGKTTDVVPYTLTIVPPTPPQLEQPTLTVDAKTADSLTLTIGAVANAEKYTLECAPDRNFTISKTFTYTSAGEKTISGLSSGTKYYFRVKAAAETYAPSSWKTIVAATAKAPLSTPKISVGNPTTSSLDVKITAVGGADNYVLEYGADSNFSTGTTTLKLEEAGTTTVSGLDSGTKYYFRVKAQGSKYLDSEWKTTSASTAKEPLAAPTLVKSKVTDSSIRVKFAAIDGAEKYVLEYSADEDLPAKTTTALELTEAGMVTVDGLESGTTYYFRIKAQGAKYLDSEWKTLVLATEKGTLAAPVLEYVSSDPSSITVKIGKVDGAEKYVLEYSQDQKFPENAVKSTVLTKAGEASASDLDFGTVYFLRVKAVADNYLDSEWRDISAVTEKAQLTRPKVTAGNETSSTVTLSIGAVPNAEKYAIEYSTSSTFPEDLTQTLTVTEAGDVAIEGLKPATKYYFHVKAIAERAYDSDWRLVQTTTDLASLAAPTIVKSKITSTSIRVRIGEVEGAEKYVLEYSADPDFAQEKTKALELTEPGMATAEELIPETKYYFRVKAVAENCYDSEWRILALTTEDGPLDTPTLELGTVGTTTIQVKIGAVEQAESYVLEYSSDAQFPEGSVETLTLAQAGEASIDGLRPGTEYFIRVKAAAETEVDSNWEVLTAVTRDLSVTPQRLTVPTIVVGNTSFGNGQGATLVLSIKEGDSASRYEIEYSTASDFSNSEKRVLEGSSCTLEVLAYGQEYYLRAKALGDGVDSLDSEYCDAFIVATPNSLYDAPTVTQKNGVIDGEEVVSLQAKLDVSEGKEVEYYWSVVNSQGVVFEDFKLGGDIYIFNHGEFDEYDG